MKFVQITRTVANLRGEMQRDRSFTVPVNQGPTSVFDDRTIDEIINDGDADSLDFCSYDFGNQKQYVFDRNHKSFGIRFGSRRENT